MWKLIGTVLSWLLAKAAEAKAAEAPDAVPGFALLTAGQSNRIGKLENRLDATELRLDECERDRDELHSKLEDCEIKHMEAESRIRALETKTAV